MKGKKIRAEILIGIAFLLIISGAIGMTLTPDKEPDRSIKNRFGDVTWNHELHARMKEISNCTVCHHTAQQGGTQLRPCRDCHKLPDNIDTLIMPEMFMEVTPAVYGDENGPPGMTAMHGKCTGCHVAMKEGPTECRDCHAQTFSSSRGRTSWNHTRHARAIDMNSEPGMADNCVSCHHQDTEAKTDGDFRACSTCHLPVAKKGIDIRTGIQDHQDAKHGQCQSCHVEFNPEEDSVECVDCHRKLSVEGKPETVRPSLEQAIHGRCSECHSQESPELTAAMPTRCDDCHRADPSWISVPGMNTVVWDHKRHAEFGKIECETCHHTDHADASKLACGSCHGKDHFEVSSLEEALKEQCIECHKKEDVGLTSWESMTYPKMGNGYFKYTDQTGSFWWDHRFHALDLSLSCRNCHHNTLNENGTFVTAAKAQEPWTEADGHIQNCKNCHGSDGPKPGSVAEGSSAPSSHDAFKRLCISCHRKLGAGTQKWENFFTLEPIRR